jgi:hypothetical protein
MRPRPTRAWTHNHPCVHHHARITCSITLRH